MKPRFNYKHFRAITFWFLLLLGFLSSNAQDPNFSQFFSSPLTLNPALTGKFNGSYRVAGNYRNQWPTISNAFITSTLSLDGKIFENKLSSDDVFGVGLLLLTDKTADKILNTNYVGVSAAYHKALDEDGWQQLSVGFQGGFFSKRLDGFRLQFGDEIDQLGGFTKPSAEPVNNRQISMSMFDFNIGALYNGSTDGENNFYLGASYYHLNHPKESFLGDGGYKLYPRLTLHGGGRVYAGSSNNFLYFSVLQSFQQSSSNSVIGAAMAFDLGSGDDGETNLYMGTWYRLKDAIIPYVGLEFNSMQIGISYDVNISSLKTASQKRGGIEISIIHTNFLKLGKAGFIPCPVF